MSVFNYSKFLFAVKFSIFHGVSKKVCSPSTPLLLCLPLPPSLLTHTHTHTHSPPPAHALLPQVFHQIVYGLREATSRSSLVDDKICEGYFFLAELCDMRPDSTNFRPICQLVRPLHLSTPTPSSSSPLPHTHTHTHTHKALLRQEMATKGVGT